MKIFDIKRAASLWRNLPWFILEMVLIFIPGLAALALIALWIAGCILCGGSAPAAIFTIMWWTIVAAFSSLFEELDRWCSVKVHWCESKIRGS